MLAIPDRTVHRTKLADWLELNALGSPDGWIGFGTLISAAALSEDEQSEDIADEDIWQDRLVLSVQGEIERRLQACGEEYPFRISSNGESMQLVEVITGAGYVYLFCLLLSHASDYTILPKSLSPKVTNKERDLFQVCATVAAAGFVQGNAFSFGFPRPDDTKFLEALHAIYERFGEGKPVKKPRIAAPIHVKDAGIDVIAWRQSVDGLPGTQYLLGQVASGKNWKEKSVLADSEHFHKYWFELPPASSHQNAMFMPFCLEPEEKNDGTSYDELLKSYLHSVNFRFGVLFYRYRISNFFSKGLIISDGGQHVVERAGDLSKIVKWVGKHSKRLRAA